MMESPTPFVTADEQAEAFRVAREIPDRDPPATGPRLTTLAEARMLARALLALKAESEALRAIIARWEALGRCEDEFGPQSEFCVEYADSLDTAIDEARTLVQQRSS